MNTQADPKTARLATISSILGILSLGLVLIAILILIWVRLPSGPTDDASLFSLGFLAVFLMLGGSILGVPGWLTGSIARRKNKEGSADPKVNQNASIGQRLSATAVGITILIFAAAWIFQQRTPLPGPVTPIPLTAAP